MKSFEYKVLYHNNANFVNKDLEGELNHFGTKGWELVSSTPVVTGDEDSVRTADVILIFKREI